MSVAPARLIALDSVRGVALLGILVVNLSAMTMPLVQSGLPSAFDLLDVVAWIPMKWVFETKFMVLFSALFGVGAALQREGARRAGRAFAPLFRRRMLVLAAVGLAHAWLLYSGDILLHYAMVGLFLPGLLGMSARRRLTLAVVLVALPWLVNIGLHGAVATMGESATPAISLGFGPQWVRDMAASGFDPRTAGFQGAEQWVRTEGGPLDALALRGGTWLGFQAILLLTLQPLRTLGVFLIGAHLWQAGVFQSRGASLRRGLVRWGLGAGLAAEALVVSLHAMAGFDELHPLAVVAEAVHGLSGLGMGLGLAAGLATVALRPGWSQILHPIAQTGRMALTNYLAQSIVGVALVSLLGFGALHRVWHLPVAMLVVASQAGLALWWLARFRMGPAEWLWRALTYRRLPPFLGSAS